MSRSGADLSVIVLASNLHYIILSWRNVFMSRYGADLSVNSLGQQPTLYYPIMEKCQFMCRPGADLSVIVLVSNLTLYYPIMEKCIYLGLVLTCQ